MSWAVEEKEKKKKNKKKNGTRGLPGAREINSNEHHILTRRYVEDGKGTLRLSPNVSVTVSEDSEVIDVLGYRIECSMSHADVLSNLSLCNKPALWTELTDGEVTSCVQVARVTALPLKYCVNYGWGFAKTLVGYFVHTLFIRHPISCDATSE
jgi:hypothetical protein